MTQAAVATIGHNKPPEILRFEAIEADISDLYDEAKVWLDGEAVKTQADADAVSTLIDRIRKAMKEAEASRKKEVEPLDTAKKEIQDRYNPLIADNKTITGKAVRAINAAKKALEPFLQEQDRIKREAEQKAREEAERKQREAQEAMKAREADNLESVEVAEALAAEAKRAEEEAARAAKVKVHAKGEGRATGLRTRWVAKMASKKEAALWVMNEHPESFLEFVQRMADADVRAGKRTIRGFDVVEERVL